MHGFPFQRLDEPQRFLLALILPRGDMAELLIVAFRLAVGILIFLAEMPAARLLARQGVAGHQFAELEEVRHPAGAFEGDVKVLFITGDHEVFLKFAAKGADLLAWLDGLGIREAVWGGASMGGALSLWAAAHHPDRVRAIVSISGPPYAPLDEDKAWWATHRPLVAAGRFEEFFDANIRLRMGEEALRRLQARPDRYAEVTGRLRQHSVASLLALLDETYSRTEWIADCARIRCPVLVISGSEDHFPTVAMSRRVAETVPGARLHVVQGGPHFPNRSHRAGVQREIGRFLTDIGVLSKSAGRRDGAPDPP